MGSPKVRARLRCGHGESPQTGLAQTSDDATCRVGSDRTAIVTRALRRGRRHFRRPATTAFVVAALVGACTGRPSPLPTTHVTSPLVALDVPSLKLAVLGAVGDR